MATRGISRCPAVDNILLIVVLALIDADKAAYRYEVHAKEPHPRCDHPTRLLAKRHTVPLSHRLVSSSKGVLPSLWLLSVEAILYLQPRFGIVSPTFSAVSAIQLFTLESQLASHFTPRSLLARNLWRPEPVNSPSEAPSCHVSPAQILRRVDYRSRT